MTQPATTPRRRNRRGDGSQLRGEILEAARDILESTGQDDAVTLRAVARAVGITAPSIYPHFADREAIKLAVVEQTFTTLADVLRPALGRGTDPVSSLHSVARAYLDFAEEHPHLYRVLFERHRTEQVEPGSAGKDVASILGADAYGVLIDAVGACVEDEADARAATVRVWVSLHGMASLRASLPWFPWPPREQLAVELLTRSVDPRQTPD